MLQSRPELQPTDLCMTSAYERDNYRSRCTEYIWCIIEMHRVYSAEDYPQDLFGLCKYHDAALRVHGGTTPLSTNSTLITAIISL